MAYEVKHADVLLGQKVRIESLPGTPLGVVIGKWELLFGKKQFQVRCVDSTGRPFENWWFAEDLRAPDGGPVFYTIQSSVER
jgi:hypothetical protein